MRHSSAAAFGLGIALACTPALAQTGAAASQSSPAPSPSEAANMNKPALGTATINPTGIPPSERNPLLTNQGRVRIGKLIGTDVYNQDDKKIGTVKDVLVDQNGQVQAVISTNGKRVLAPWNKLEFGDAKLNSDNKVLMLKETQQSLAAFPAYNPDAKAAGKG